MLTYVFSALALLTSMASLGVSIVTYRTAGPKVALAGHGFSLFPHEVWLQVRIVNAGKGEVDIDGATCDLLGPTVTLLPHRLKAAASHLIVFRAPTPEGLGRSGSVTVNIGLGNGRNLTSQVRMTEIEQATLRQLWPNVRAPVSQPLSSWLPLSQEEL